MYYPHQNSSVQQKYSLQNFYLPFFLLLFSLLHSIHHYCCYSNLLFAADEAISAKLVIIYIYTSSVNRVIASLVIRIIFLSIFLLYINILKTLYSPPLVREIERSRERNDTMEDATTTQQPPLKKSPHNNNRQHSSHHRAQSTKTHCGKPHKSSCIVAPPTTRNNPHKTR